MIKTFEQFVAAKYGNPVNEAFQSSKLREIIKQHGKPEHSWDNKMLYDLKDDEIIDVVANRKEYKKKYLNNSGEQATFMLELEDGACIVISNLDIFNEHKDGWKARFEKDELFRKRHKERHKGNLGKHVGNDVHNQHLDNVTELMKNRFMKNLDKNIPEIISDIDGILEDESIILYDHDKSDEYEYDFDTEYNGVKCSVIVQYNLHLGETYEQYGGYYCNATVDLKGFYIDFGRDSLTDEEMGITPETYPDLFADHQFEEIECGIADPYEFYGVKRSDFF